MVRGPVRRSYREARFTRQDSAASARSAGVKFTCTSFSASAKVAGDTSGPTAGPVPKAGGAPGGSCVGSCATSASWICALLFEVTAAPMRPSDVWVKKSLRDLDMGPPRSIVAESRGYDAAVLAFTRGPAVSGSWPCRLFACDDGAAGVQMVEVEHGVEDQEIAAHGFSAPHRIVGKENDVALAVGNVHDSGLFGDFVAAGDHAAEKQVFFGGEAKDDARLLIFGRNRKAGKVRQVLGNVEFLLVGSAFDRFFRRLVGTGLDDVGIGAGAPTAGTAGTGGAFVGSTPTTRAAEVAADSDDRTGAEINVEFVVVTVGDGAFLVIDRGEHHAAGGLHGASIGNIHHFRHTAGDGERSAGLHSNEQTSLADEALEICKALIAEPAANIVSGVQAGGHKVGSLGGIFPGTRIASHRQAAQRGAQASGAASAHGRKDDHVKLFAEVRGFA